MVYSKQTWKEDNTTPITAARLNKLETQYEEALSVAQARKITSDNGGVILSASASTDDILAMIVAAGAGLNTFYAASGSKNLPGSDSYRGISHITGVGPANGWVQAYDYYGNPFTNYILNGVWQGWDNQKVLWTGPLGPVPTATYMASWDTITPSKKLSHCKNGWILVWSDMGDNSAAVNSDFVYSYIPKYAKLYNGASHYFSIMYGMDANGVSITGKRVYVYDDKLVGHAQNEPGNNTNGSSDVCLRAVLEW